MRHRKKTFKVGRTKSHRDSMMANMLVSLITHKRIKTTVTKAKELRRLADKAVTLAKKGDLHHRRVAISRIRDVEAVGELFDSLVKRFKGRDGGYTRIIRLGQGRGDDRSNCLIEFVEKLSKEKNTIKQIKEA